MFTSNLSLTEAHTDYEISVLAQRDIEEMVSIVEKIVSKYGLHVDSDFSSVVYILDGSSIEITVSSDQIKKDQIKDEHNILLESQCWYYIEQIQVRIKLIKFIAGKRS